MNEKKLHGGAVRIRTDVTTLEKIQKAISKRLTTEVGILGSKAGAREKPKPGQEETNAEIGAKHEFGVYNESGRIPRRSFLSMPLTRSAKEIFERKSKMAVLFKDAVESGTSADDAWMAAHRNLGIIAEQIVDKSFQQSGPGWPPNSPMTVALKGSAKPLIDTGQLRLSITSRVVTRK